MAARGCRVIVLADEKSVLLERARACTELEVHPVAFSSLSFLNPRTVGKWASFFREEKVSRLILGLPKDMKVAGIAAKLAGVERIYYRRGSAVPVRGSLFNRFLYRRVLDGVIVNSRETGRLLTSRCPDLVPSEKIHRVYNGLDAGAFDAELAGALPVYREGIVPFSAGGPLLIGNAGRLTVQKGQKFLLYMSRALQDMGIAHRVLIAGDGELRDELHRLAATLGVDETVEFAGFLPKLGSFWKSIDCFVLSSLWEGFGFVLAEAMLAEKPLLAFNANSMPELVRQGQNGLLIPLPGDGESDEDVGRRLAAAVADLVKDTGRFTRMGAEGRAIALAEYDHAASLEHLIALLR